jgi:hypothetical protein
VHPRGTGVFWVGVPWFHPGMKRLRRPLEIHMRVRCFP